VRADSRSGSRSAHSDRRECVCSRSSNATFVNPLRHSTWGQHMGTGRAPHQPDRQRRRQSQWACRAPPECARTPPRGLPSHTEAAFASIEHGLTIGCSLFVVCASAARRSFRPQMRRASAVHCNFVSHWNSFDRGASSEPYASDHRVVGLHRLKDASVPHGVISQRDEPARSVQQTQVESSSGCSSSCDRIR